MRRPHGGHVLGASPQIPFASDLSARHGDLICPQDQLLDLRTIQSWYQSGALKGGLWLPDWAYQEQSAGAAVTTTGQVVGVWSPAASTYSATQTTTANKPLAALTPITRKPWMTADSTDVLPVVFPTSLGSACTIARATPTGVTFDENQLISTTWNDLIRPYQYNSAVLVADRQLTAREKAVVSRVLGAYVPDIRYNNIVNNGTFDVDYSGWTAVSATLSVSNGELSVDVTGSGGGIQQNLPVGGINLVVGGIYSISFDTRKTTYSGSTLTIFLANNSIDNQNFTLTGVMSNIKFVGVQSAAASVKQLYLKRSDASTGVIYFDNIMVRQIL